MHWIVLALRRSTDFRGRSRRREFWPFTAFLFVLAMVVGIVVAALIPDRGEAEQVRGAVLIGLFVVIGLAQTALTVRRLHDIGKSGWFILIFAFPVIGTVIWGFWMATDGQARPNRYGPDPKGRGNDHPVFAPSSLRPAAMPKP